MTQRSTTWHFANGFKIEIAGNTNYGRGYYIASAWRGEGFKTIVQLGDCTQAGLNYFEMGRPYPTKIVRTLAEAVALADELAGREFKNRALKPTEDCPF